MKSVFIPKGIVITNRGEDDYTKYVAFMNTNTCEYYFKTYVNNQIKRISLLNYNNREHPVFLGRVLV